MQEKCFVKVRADFTLDGRVVPLKFRTEDGPEDGTAQQCGGEQDVRNEVLDAFRQLCDIAVPVAGAGGYGLSVFVHDGEMEFRSR